MLSDFERNVLEKLSGWASIAAPILRTVAKASHQTLLDELALCDEAGLPRTQVPAVISILGELKNLGVVAEHHGLRWELVGDRDRLRQAASLLEAVGFYRDYVHTDLTTATVVVTRPPKPSRLEQALQELGFASGRIEVTSEAFGDIARASRNRFVVMTPFLDRHGARWLSDLLHKAPTSVCKTVILRYLSNPGHPSFPHGYAFLKETLTELRVAVHDYAYPRPSGKGIETFHAKVVLADDDYAYVGSANMNRASLEYSMEMGVLVRGEAARRVAKIVDAILRLTGRPVE